MLVRLTCGSVVEISAHKCAIGSEVSYFWKSENKMSTGIVLSIIDPVTGHEYTSEKKAKKNEKKAN